MVTDVPLPLAAMAATIQVALWHCVMFSNQLQVRVWRWIRWSIILQQFRDWFRVSDIESQDDGGNNFRFFFVVYGGVCNLGGRGGVVVGLYI